MSAALVRCGFALALVLAVGCSAVPSAAQTTEPTEVVAAPPAPLVVPAPAAPPTQPALPATLAAPTPAPTLTAVPTPALASTAAAAPTQAPTPITPVGTSVADQGTQAAGANPACDVTARPDPLPAPGSPRAADFFRSFHTPLPPAPLYNPAGQKRVGLQAGHWLTNEVPAELSGLQAGATGGGKQEWQVNLDLAQRTAALLEAAGIEVDVLPSTIPPGYQANAFVAIHADGDTSGQDHGFKVTRPGFSSIPDFDDQLVAAINQTYGAETGLPRDDAHISLRMTYYYAFNSRRYCHAVAPGVPQAIIEMAYLTNAGDREYLLGNPDLLAQGLADSIQVFLNGLPPAPAH